MYHKPFSTLISVTLTPQDRIPPERKIGFTYSMGDICEEHYMDETAKMTRD